MGTDKTSVGYLCRDIIIHMWECRSIGYQHQIWTHYGKLSMPVYTEFLMLYNKFLDFIVDFSFDLIGISF